MATLQPTAAATVSSADEYSAFLDGVMQRAGGNELNPQVRAAMKYQLMVEVEKRLRAETLAALTLPQFDEYAKAVGDKPMGLVEQVALFERIIPNYHELLERALKEVTDEFVALTNAN